MGKQATTETTQAAAPVTPEPPTPAIPPDVQPPEPESDGNPPPGMSAADVGAALLMQIPILHSATFKLDGQFYFVDRERGVECRGVGL
jgi:hypothetical protein